MQVASIAALGGCILISFPISIYTEEFGKEYNNFVKKTVINQTSV
jgi:hypothetical protein